MEPGAIAVRGLSKVFARAHPAPQPALRSVDLEVARGEVVAVMGPNGAGKTTLLKILATLIAPDSGDAWVGGASVVTDAKRARSLVGLLIADDRSFYARLSGRQNLEFFAALYGMARGDALDKIAELGELLEIGALDRAFQEYSTGAKQRLALARCLLGGADVLLMDEPTRSLDPAAAAKFRRIVKEKLSAGKSKTVLFTTHQPDEAKQTADRTVVLEQGSLRPSP